MGIRFSVNLDSDSGEAAREMSFDKQIFVKEQDDDDCLYHDK